jgi:hypothetical protein
MRMPGDRMGLAMRVPGDRMGCGRCVSVSAAVRTTIASHRARGEMQDPEGEQDPHSQAHAHRPQTGDPPLTAHAATLPTTQGHRAAPQGLSATVIRW